MKFPAALAAATLLLSLSARADVPPERIENPCDGKKAGDPCDPAGICKEGSCCTTRHVSATIQHYESRKPLSDQNPDIINPPTTCSPCLKCESVPVTNVPVPAVPPAPSDKTPPSAPSKPAAANGAMCTVAPGPGDLDAAGLLVAMLFAGLMRSRRPDAA